MSTCAVRMLSRFVLLTALVCLAVAGAAQAQSYPARQATFINDFAGLLDAATAAELNRELAEARSSAGIELVIVTIDRIADYGTSDTTIESFATNLFNTWGIGDAQTNRGALLLTAVGDRKVRLELGRGYGRDFDAWAKMVIDETILPAFRSNDYNGGIKRGAREAIRVLSSGTPPPVPSAPSDSGGLWFVALIGGAVALGVYYFYLRLRCPQCGAIGLHIRSHVLSPATEYSTGEKEVVRDCPNCGFHDMRLVTLAMLSSASSSSSSSDYSSSDSGGGSSDGGGASGSW